MASKTFEEILNKLPQKDRDSLSEIKEQSQNKVAEASNVKASDMDASKETAYKNVTGRPELDKNVGGYDQFNKPTTEKPLDDKTKEQATAAVAPMKEQTAAPTTTTSPQETTAATPKSQGNSSTFAEIQSKPTTEKTPQPTEEKKQTL